MANRPWDEKREALTALLKSLRNEAGLTQTEMANLLGKPQSYVSKYESGERRLDFVEVLEVCESLRVTPQAFVARYYAGS
ncbi:helix-turn-helix domain-containing protein [Cellvibrio fibrivorans]|uniref:Transcriptional regulator with XRE-family HTH domain n=1 Tax=Cellvibrio fibrivorans TaxID=126350 RepID=A0ABU1V2S7_9GAMM|nr:helix-turn-helix transcriptional regulator [Cellvibrio fibrivorans]MDR7091761.1 transcriptional regulator with XRE-family HTH domain [Cellvibrio fibrivorans]